MKAITVRPYWSTAMKLLFKHNETRSFRRSYRGLLAIHTSAKWDAFDMDCTLRFCEQFRDQLSYAQVKELMKPNFGHVLCIVNLVDIVRVETVRDSLSPMERAAGNYDDGRFAWITEMVEVLEKPVPAKGKLDIWNWERP